MIKGISVKEAFELKNTIFIDTRSPKEFAEDHILGAVNVPLLSDEERHEIGILYKQKSRNEAIERGIELFPQKIPTIYNAVKDHKDKTIIVYCARGGMRSGIVASLIESIDYKVLKIEGGYKSFRHYILNELNNFKLKAKIVSLFGLTCSGKTKLLNKFDNSLDLEGLAQHKGSLYGSVGLNPNSQKRFQNLLLQKLRELNNYNYIITEGESRKIGNVEIPLFLWKAMKNGINIFVKMSINRRVEECVKEYFNSRTKIKQIIEITPSLKNIISKKRKEEIIQLIKNNNYDQAVKILLEEYYDPQYKHFMKSTKFDFEVCNDDSNKAKKELKKLLN